MKDGKHGGIEHLLNLISSSKATLIEAFNNKGIQETYENAGQIAKLTDARALIRTRNGYRINPKLAQFINYYLETETSQYLNTQHAERIPEIRELSKHYLDAKYQNKGKKLEEESLDILEGVVYEVITDLQESCRRLRSRVENDFGYGKSLQQKTVENEKAIEQAKKLVQGLKAFSFSVLAEMASEDSTLNELLCYELPEVVKHCQVDLERTIERLRDLMMIYRARQRDKDLISAFDNFLEQELSWSTDVDEVYSAEACADESMQRFLLTEPVLALSHADLDNNEQDDALTDIAVSVLTTGSESREPRRLAISEPQQLGTDLVSEVTADDPIETHCDHFFSLCVEGEGAHSALEYYQSVSGQFLDGNQPLNCGEDVWMFALLSYYESLVEEERQFLSCVPQGTYYYNSDVEEGAAGYGNIYIQDINVELVLP